MSAEVLGTPYGEHGVYWTIILYLHSNKGRCSLDLPPIKTLCACENFEKVWQKISKKFSPRNKTISHKRVNKELRKTKNHIQLKRTAGLAGTHRRLKQR
jgi:uncharacterized protein YdaU (DUF1376 family)